MQELDSASFSVSEVVAGGEGLWSALPPIRGQVARRAGPQPTRALLFSPAKREELTDVKKEYAVARGRRRWREGCGLVFTGAWRGGAGLNIFCGLRRRATLWEVGTKEPEKRRLGKKGRRKASWHLGRMRPSLSFRASSLEELNYAQSATLLIP